MGKSFSTAQVINSMMMTDDKILYVVVSNDMPQ